MPAFDNLMRSFACPTSPVLTIASTERLLSRRQLLTLHRVWVKPFAWQAFHELLSMATGLTNCLFLEAPSLNFRNSLGDPGDSHGLIVLLKSLLVLSIFFIRPK